uniref:Uncharacterized protein n=1 Tax=Strombidium rassoulzadegani TaxID=1082188 RepID=A0A7S3CWM8_9SPIT|mmetsp:Transcript_9759/g.16438  ORF Transcript_9759/g.16438 Transcript_9759/m.16438 type:complete len:170 (+) Transcript_9759:23-532(+)|eukprot:CAMPEP_0168614188 /NCGR_PEP_ID=MMETSP0449_2-20121227/3841_1 /TAXON_ID=1082188 /ORGANISM="Strombidium rassoulzadegani, Strain ras09" /LENGTH=169 /DNA_ID=CAMNT_0008654851 /DNA_START=12 /DNA_END=521 /DNA_ORIENTATION=-
MSGTPYFQQKIKNSLNSFTNGEDVDSWAPDSQYYLEFSEVMERARLQLDQGILLKLSILRQRQLEKLAIEKCFKDSSLNFSEAEVCETFLYDNDFKLKALNNFYSENTVRHVKEYMACRNDPQVLEQNTLVGKEKAYMQCHNEWVKNFKSNTVYELEERARKFLGKNLQ